MVKNILAGIGILAIVIFVALLVGVFAILPRLLTAEPFTVKPDVGYSLQGVVVSVAVTEGDINAKLAESPQIAEGLGRAIGSAGSMPPVKTKNLRVKLEKDRITGAIDADIWGDGTYVTGAISGKVFVAGGKPAMELQRVTMGVMPFPSSLVSQLNGELNRRLQTLDINLPMDLKEIRIDEGKLTVTGTVDIRKLQLPAAMLAR